MQSVPVPERRADSPQRARRDSCGVASDAYVYIYIRVHTYMHTYVSICVMVFVEEHRAMVVW